MYVTNSSVVTIFLVYIAQSFFIALFTFIQMIEAKEYYISGTGYSDKHIILAKKAQIKISIYFLLQYSLLLSAYAVFTLSMFYGIASSFSNNNNIISEIGLPNIKVFIFGSLFFFINQLFSFYYNEKKFMPETNIDKVIESAYLRFLPLYIILFIGGISFDIFSSLDILLILFFVIKTIIDLVSHDQKYSKLRAKTTIA